MKLHHIVVGIIVVSMITLGAITYVNDMGDNYGETADLSGMDKTRDRLEKQQNLSVTLNEDINEITMDEGTVTGFLVPYRLLKAAWGSVKLFFNSWATVGTMITETGEGIEEAGVPLPNWLIPSIISFIVVILIAMLIYAIFKWRFTD